MYARGHAISSLARAFAPLLRRPIVPPLLCRSGVVVMLPTIGSQRVASSSRRVSIVFSLIHVRTSSANRRRDRCSVSRPKMSAAALERKIEHSRNARTQPAKFHAIAPFFSSVHPAAISSGHRIFSIQQF